MVQYPITTQYSELMQYPITAKYSEMMQYPITAKYSEMMQYPITAKYSEMMQYSIITQDTDPRSLFYGSVLYLELSELSYSDMFSSQNKKLLKMTINTYKQFYF